ncbi:hypothetical protein ACHAXA_003859 [Cyclostephanos tholiformis]|uniref:Methyltransferase domain-containing protein n=1 Tax=Cyclostephanos tholiformis TaxID=382380 RepID=A0ABD3RWR9_9STRA
MLAPRNRLWSTPCSVIDMSMKMANLDSDDVVYDVGCGDGRVLIRMASMSVVIPADDDVVIDDYDRCRSPRHGRHHHACKSFVGIEISNDRANEARCNVKRAMESGLIPPHVDVEIICGNALDCRRRRGGGGGGGRGRHSSPRRHHDDDDDDEVMNEEEYGGDDVEDYDDDDCVGMDTTVDYSKATVIFMYLVPRGLRLMKDLLWPESNSTSSTSKAEGREYGGDDGQDVDDDNDDAEGQERRTTTKLLTKGRTMTTMTTESETSNVTSDNGCNDDINNDDSDGVSTGMPTNEGRRIRRIITYMSPFVGTPHVRKEHCTVEHQEGASWPLYLYHCPMG